MPNLALRRLKSSTKIKNKNKKEITLNSFIQTLIFLVVPYI